MLRAAARYVIRSVLLLGLLAGLVTGGWLSTGCRQVGGPIPIRRS